MRPPSDRQKKQKQDLEEVFEIDENLLKKELAKMVRLREEAEPEDADPAAQHGGEVLGDVILDIDERIKLILLDSEQISL